jgi:hypothetical protein
MASLQMLLRISQLQTIGYIDCVAGALNAIAPRMNLTGVLAGTFALLMLARFVGIGWLIDVNLAPNKYPGRARAISHADVVSLYASEFHLKLLRHLLAFAKRWSLEL